MMQPGMLIQKSASTVILVQLVDMDVSEERTAFIFSVDPEAGDSRLFMVFVSTTRQKNNPITSLDRQLGRQEFDAPRKSMP